MSSAWAISCQSSVQTEAVMTWADKFAQHPVNFNCKALGRVYIGFIPSTSRWHSTPLKWSQLKHEQDAPTDAWWLLEMETPSWNSTNHTGSLVFPLMLFRINCWATSGAAVIWDAIMFMSHYCIWLIFLDLRALDIWITSFSILAGFLCVVLQKLSLELYANILQIL